MLVMLLACFGRDVVSTPQPLADDGPVTLGWRLVPGQVLTYRLTTQTRTGPDTVLRVEHWDYLVTEVRDDGVAVLDGELVALGAELIRDGTPQYQGLDPARQDEQERLGEQAVHLELAMDGRLVAIEGLAWADALPHRLLALRLQDGETSGGDRWPDPVLARPYAHIMPVGLELTVEGYEMYDGLYQEAEMVLAHVTTRGAVRPDAMGAPEVWISGDAWWDTMEGVVERRSLVVTLANVQGEPGDLTLSVERVHPDRPAP
ncbi:MAG: hypothetical protein GY913_22475 [Proteobacteria bacterium]|nr:hypothetical protein [Pseudomonadota bacterium]MCP4919676.1 hypothetical protein [Pseudomonadota bacterium]